MRTELDGTPAHSRPHTPLPITPLTGTRSPHPEPYSDTWPEDEDHQRQWAREEQQMMIREQDRTIDTISGTLTTLAQQAGLMGEEIGVHNEYVFGTHCSVCGRKPTFGI